MNEEMQAHVEEMQAHSRKMNRERQARWRLANLERSRKQGREKSKRYSDKMRQIKRLESPQIEFQF